MAVLKRRSKMVSFRLSEQEYADLMSQCTDRGARSLSDFAREAVQGLLATQSLHSNGNGNGLETEVRRLCGRMDELDRELKRLANQVAKTTASGEAAS